MKDKYLSAIAIFWMGLSLLAGFYFFDTKYEFIFRQLCEVVLLAILMQLSKGKPYSFSIFHVLCALSTAELIDELQFGNTQIRLNDYIFVGAGIVGLAIAWLRIWYLTNKRKWHNSQTRKYRSKV